MKDTQLRGFRYHEQAVDPVELLETVLSLFTPSGIFDVVDMNRVIETGSPMFKDRTAKAVSE